MGLRPRAGLCSPLGLSLVSWVAVCGAAPGLALGELSLGCAQAVGVGKPGGLSQARLGRMVDRSLSPRGGAGAVPSAL